jgi:hypothetical protein
MLASAVSIPSLLIAAAVFVVLFVILGVTLWVSIVAGAAALVLSAAVAGGTLIAKRDSHPRGHRA